MCSKKEGFSIEESTVVRRVRKWLEDKSEYSKRKSFRVYGSGEEGSIPANVNSGDLLVQKENEIVAQVECKRIRRKVGTMTETRKEKTEQSQTYSSRRERKNFF